MVGFLSNTLFYAFKCYNDNVNRKMSNIWGLISLLSYFMLTALTLYPHQHWCSDCAQQESRVHVSALSHDSCALCQWTLGNVACDFAVFAQGFSPQEQQYTLLPVSYFPATICTSSPRAPPV